MHILGACHVDELMYLFNIGMFPELEGREKDVSDALLTIWTNFAKTGYDVFQIYLLR